MTRSKQRLLPAVVILLIGLASCSKGGTSLDQDSHTPREQPSGAGDPGESPCGNGKIDEGEDCDGAMLGDVTCTNLGFASGMLGCDPITCTYETTMCRLPSQSGSGGTGGLD